MKKSKEYKISVIFSIIALVLFSVSIITGLIPGLVYSVDKICGYLGCSFLFLGFMFMNKSKDNNEEK